LFVIVRGRWLRRTGSLDEGLDGIQGLPSRRDPAQNLVQFGRIKPDAVISANVDNHSAAGGVKTAGHELSAFDARTIQSAGLVLSFRGFLFCQNRIGKMDRSASGPVPQFPKSIDAQPQPRAGLAFQHIHFFPAQRAAGQDFLAGASRASRFRLFAGDRLRREPIPARRAVAGLVADSGQAIRANGVKIPFVQGEVRSAETTVPGFLLASASAGRAPHYASGVPLGRLHLEHRPAMAAKLRANLPGAGFITPAAFFAGNEQSHGKADIHEGMGSGSICSNGKVMLINHAKNKWCLTPSKRSF
jgi:hypothetical protein